MICLNQHMAAVFGNRRKETPPLLGINLAYAACLVQPGRFRRPAQEYTAQYQSLYPFGMSLGISQRQSAAPRTAEHQPFPDTQHFTDSFDIRHQIPSRVVFRTSIRARTSATTLVDNDDTEPVGIEKTSAGGRSARARSAMQKNNRHTIRIARLFPIDFMNIGYTQISAV